MFFNIVTMVTVFILMLWQIISTDGKQHRKTFNGKSLQGDYDAYSGFSAVRCAAICEAVSCVAWNRDQSKNECRIYRNLALAKAPIDDDASQATFLPQDSPLEFYRFIDSGNLFYSWNDAKGDCENIGETLKYFNDVNLYPDIAQDVGGGFYVGLTKVGGEWEDLFGDVIPNAAADFILQPVPLLGQNCLSYQSLVLVGQVPVSCSIGVALTIAVCTYTQ